MPRLGSNQSPMPEEVAAFIRAAVAHLTVERRTSEAVQWKMLTMFGLFVPLASVQCCMSHRTCDLCGGSGFHLVQQHRVFEHFYAPNFMAKFRHMRA